MFPKRPRFEPMKVSDVPGPNSYNIVQDSQLDSYKRGAFLEKTDRFLKERESEVPGPGTYDPENKNHIVKPLQKSCVPPVNPVDRYTVLQRKVDDLEKVHHDGKKYYQNEIERLKLELTRSQKVNVEQTEKLDKQKRHAEILDSRIQELKKASSSDQAEIKDLRSKLRTSEHERAQTAMKQAETGELKKSVHSLEAKRKGDIREREQKITELEKALVSERKRREIAEAELQATKTNSNGELQAVRAALDASKIQLTELHAELRISQGALETLKETSAAKEEASLAQLQKYRILLSQAAEEYGRLTTTSVPVIDYTLLRHQLAASHMRTLRLERKLANSEDQVIELANLIRQLKEANMYLLQQLEDVEAEASFVGRALIDLTFTKLPEIDTSLADILNAVSSDLVDHQKDTHTMERITSELLSELYRFTAQELLMAYSVSEKQLQEEQLMVQQYATDLSSALTSHEAIAACLETCQKDKTIAEENLRASAETIHKHVISSEQMVHQLAEVEKRLQEGTVSHNVVLKRETDKVQRLTGTIQRYRMAEDAFRAEIEQLTTELTDAERYQEAYNLLSEEVGLLVTRNQLAEDEAQKLSKFNAEILGHNNPAQRIMYVDRIRRELAEAKHKIIILTQEQENILAEKGRLQHELGAYKSVTIPPELKARTTITRVERLPLTNLINEIQKADDTVKM